MKNKIISKIKAIALYKNPFIYLADLFGFRKEQKIVYELKNGLKFEVRSGTCDRGIIDEIFAYKIYSPSGFEIKENDTVLDIGAQIGVFSVYAAASAKAGRVYSFEPFSENYALLKRNIELNSRGNIEPFQMAVAGTAGTKDFYISKNTGGHSFYGSPKQEKISVQAIALADFIKEKGLAKIDYFKMDCEGGEYDILFSLPDEILNKISKIGMEYHNLDETRHVARLREFLESRGFLVSLAGGIFPMLYALRK